MQLKKLIVEACIHSDDGSKEAGRGLTADEFQRIHRKVVLFLETGALACDAMKLRIRYRGKETIYHVSWRAELTG